jgi:hypothetical protein
MGRILLVLACFEITAGCDIERRSEPAAVPEIRPGIPAGDLQPEAQPLTGEVEVLQSWQGDYPVAQISQLPEGQREHGVGYIADPRTFENVWKAFKPDEAVPEIDLKSNLLLFTRNTQFFNRIRIGKVKVTNGVAEVLAMETMSAMPIEEKVGMSFVVVPRKGIESIQRSDGLLPIEQ